MKNKGYQAMVACDHVRFGICQIWNAICAVNIVQISKYLGTEKDKVIMQTWDLYYFRPSNGIQNIDVSSNYYCETSVLALAFVLNKLFVLAQSLVLVLAK
jgi:hypothetical protein